MPVPESGKRVFPKTVLPAHRCTSGGSAAGVLLHIA